MPLDPQAKTFLEQLALQPGPTLATQTPAQARAQMRAGTPLLGAPPPVAGLRDLVIPGQEGDLRIRVSTPEGPGPFPALVYYHGGGWVTGDVETHDALCRALTNAAQAVVVSVDYRLAPEHPYPAAVEDSYVAAVWVASHAEELNVDPARIAVGGDSAGGNLAAVVALKARDVGGPRLALQVLIYPITDCDFDVSSYVENADGYLLTREAMIWFWNHYVPDGARRTEPYASPLRAADHSNLPPALVLTAEYDPLRDEGEAYAARLAQAGVPVTITRYSGMIHGFIRRYGMFDQGREALAEVARALSTIEPVR
ncbi:MAG: alpha/beta hydrolase [Isosphaeraceae bacterium]|nr:alpha/beta hydrolase [Isosphaeraceae bacterium]